MIKLIFAIMLLFSNYLFSQNIKSSFKCEEIKKGIEDHNLYDTLSNGKLIYRLDLYKQKIYKIDIEKKSFYYVSKPIMKKIRKSIRLNNCLGIKIGKIQTVKESNIKIIRD